MAHNLTPPEGLGAPGLRLWNGMLDDLEEIDVTPDARDLRWLEDAARLADHIERLEAALREAPLVARGSHGGTVVHPLIPELRQTRALLALTLRRLDLSEPEEDAPAVLSTPEARSTKARRAAAARWAGTGR